MSDTDENDITYGAPKETGDSCHTTEPNYCSVPNSDTFDRDPDLNPDGWVYDCGLHRKAQGMRSRTKARIQYNKYSINFTIIAIKT